MLPLMEFQEQIATFLLQQGKIASTQSGRLFLVSLLSSASKINNKTNAAVPIPSRKVFEDANWPLSSLPRNKK